jgi:hypothetical protein
LESAMGPLQLVVSGIGSFIVYGLVIAAVYKLFHIAADLAEIKDTLQDIKRNTQDTAPPGMIPPPMQSSPETLMRALASGSSYPEAPAGDPAELESQH